MTPTTKTSLSQTRGRAIELDFVRGIAILVVMGIHFHTVDTGVWLIPIIEYPIKSTGRDGVTLFFVLSGFLIGGLLLRQYTDTGRIDARRFLMRRIFKIWPAYFVLILFHVLAGRHPTSTFLVQSLFHVQNYLGTAIAQTWSLAVEEHFYILLPLAMLPLAYRRVRADTILGVLGAICIVVLIARCAAVADGDIDGAYMYTQYRIDSLLVGVMLATLYWMKPELYRRIAKQKRMLIAIVVALAGWIALIHTDRPLETGIGYSGESIGCAAFIVLVLEHSASIRTSAIYRAVAWLGVYSYGIYLWHTLALAPADMFINEAAMRHIPMIVVWPFVIGLQFAVGIGLGYITTRAIEFPFLRIRDTLFPADKRSTPLRAAQSPS